MSVEIWLVLAACAALVLWICAVQPFSKWWRGEEPVRRVRISTEGTAHVVETPRSLRVLLPWAFILAVIAGALAWVVMPAPFPAEANWGAQLLGHIVAFLFCYMVVLYVAIATYFGVRAVSTETASNAIKSTKRWILWAVEALVLGYLYKLGGDLYEMLKRW